jgi:HTH-type transcriptional regulator / antitoxin HipB
VGIIFVSDVERGKPTVEMGRALRLAEMLGLDVSVERRGQ